MLPNLVIWEMLETLYNQYLPLALKYTYSVVVCVLLEFTDLETWKSPFPSGIIHQVWLIRINFDTVFLP